MWRRGIFAIVVAAAAGCGTPKATAPPDVGDDVPVMDSCLCLCDPITQTGCGVGEKCTWIRVAASSTLAIGELGCTPSGTKLAGAACEYGAAGATTGYDDCATGLVCDAPSHVDLGTGTCAAICDTAASGTAPGQCSAGSTCATHSDFFENAGDPPVTEGLCDPT